MAPAPTPALDRATASEPDSDCFFCPRLASFRHSNRTRYPDFFNAPVPSFGARDASLLIVGLAPGLKGANRTGRPFTGDYAGVLLYETLLAYGFARGTYGERADDGLTLANCRIANAVRCVPPENKPEPAEASACRGFLAATLREMPNLRAILALGRIAFESTLRALALKPSHYKFSHGGAVDLGADLKLFGSYHCSRYNTNTGRLTAEMFRAVFDEISAHLKNSC
ncbi:MAG: uracil-DNA glycosylase [Rhodomicrobium sp.]